MNANEIRKVLHASPFKPFSLRTSDGRECPVPHQDSLFVHPAGRTVIVATKEDEAFEIIDIRHVASLHFGNGREKGGKRKAG